MPSSTWAEISTPGIRRFWSLAGVAKMSPIPTAVAPTNTSLPRRLCAGMSPRSTSTYDSVGKCPCPPANEITSRSSRCHCAGAALSGGTLTPWGLWARALLRPAVSSMARLKWGQRWSGKPSSIKTRRVMPSASMSRCTCPKVCAADAKAGMGGTACSTVPRVCIMTGRTTRPLLRIALASRVSSTGLTVSSSVNRMSIPMAWGSCSEICLSSSACKARRQGQRPIAAILRSSIATTTMSG